MLQLVNVEKRFGASKAVSNVTFDVPDGQMVGVIGRSGAGKSTLLRTINRLTDVSAGRILYGGTDVTALKGSKLNAWRARCAMIFQQFNLVGRLDVISNVLIGRASYNSTLSCLFKRSTRAERAFAIQALDRLDMAPYALQRADSLSGGQQQRVAIARALVQEPRILLADEPIASLDPRSADLVMGGLRKINRQDGITVLCNLHALDVARAYCDRIVGMAQGEVVFDGLPADLTPAAARRIYGLDAAGRSDVASPPQEAASGSAHARQPALQA